MQEACPAPGAGENAKVDAKEGPALLVSLGQPHKSEAMWSLNLVQAPPAGRSLDPFEGTVLTMLSTYC